MKKFLGIKCAIVAFAGILSQQVFSAVDAPYEVGTWANFCQGAISHTFDDYPTSNATNIVSTGRDAFDAKKLHMTIFVSTGSQTANSWKSLATCFTNGHEVGSHSVSHSNPSPATEFPTSQDAIKKNVPGEKCVSYAYPFGTAVAGVLNTFIAARDAGGSLNKKSPDMAHIGITGFGSGQGGYQNTGSAMNTFADQAATGNSWAVAMHHGIGADSHNWATTNLNAMKEHLDYLDKNRSKIWCETFGNVARYIKERDAASVTKKDSTDKGITLTVTDNLADSIYNYPLTIRRPLPADWTTAIVTQKEKPVDDTIVDVSGKKYIMFNAVPDGGDVLISKNSTGIAGQRTITVSQGKISFVNSKLIIPTTGFTAAAISVSLFDLDGKVLGRYTLEKHASGIALPSKISNTAFVVKATDGTTTMVERFVAQK